MVRVEDLQNWNPWWMYKKKVPSVLKGKKRSLDSNIYKFLNEKEIIVLIGVRRCGKTTILYQVIDFLLKDFKPFQILYLNLDDEVLKRASLEEIYNTYRQNINPNKKAYLFLDEVQNMSGWERFLKKHYDLQDNVKFIISGSCASLLKKEYSALLSGRNVTFNIFPLSFKEYLDFSGTEYKSIDTTTKNKILYKLNNFMESGGFPEVYFKEKQLKRILLKNYFDDIIYKDIVSRYNINATKITSLAVYLLTNVSNLFTIRKIRNFTGLSIDSVRDYISYLEDAFLIKVSNYFAYSLKEIIQTPKKSYSIDCGLRNIAGFKFSEDAGRLAENIIFNELVRKGNVVYYWKGAGEVDFVIKNKDQSLTAINVSYTNDVDERETKALLEFKSNFKKTKELILLTKDLEKKEQGIKFIPIWQWLLK